MQVARIQYRQATRASIAVVYEIAQRGDYIPKELDNVELICSEIEFWTWKLATLDLSLL